MLKLLVVDDEAPAREAVSRIVKQYCPDAELVGATGTVKAALELIATSKPDVVLLDIEMGRKSGFDLIRHYTKPPFRIIFITAYQQYAIEAFRFSAIDYLLKPIDPTLLQKALAKASELADLEQAAVRLDSFLHNITDTAKHTKRIVLKTATDMHVVPVSDIMYCQADHNYTTFFLANKTRIVVSCALGDYEELLADFGFVRIHQSYLLNMAYLSRYEKGEGGSAILTDHTSLPIATRKKEHFLQRLAKL